MTGTDQGERATTRRAFLTRALGAGVALAGAAAGLPLTAGIAHAAGPAQAEWRFCGTCHGMFYSGVGGNYYRQNQRCPAGGLHTPMGYNFALPHSVAQTATAQAEWRFCGTCNGMFYSGVGGNYYRQNQRCPAGGLHTPMGYNFVLPHMGAGVGPVQPSTATMTAQERDVFDRINGERSRAGCGGTLQVDERLVAVAQAHSQDLANHPGLWEQGGTNQQGHAGSDGSQPADRIQRAIGKSGTENMFVGWVIGNDPGPPIDAALAYWMENTPDHHSHRDNALNCNHRTTGVGIAKGNGTVPATAKQDAGKPALFYYFTQLFVD